MTNNIKPEKINSKLFNEKKKNYTLKDRWYFSSKDGSYLGSTIKLYEKKHRKEVEGNKFYVIAETRWNRKIRSWGSDYRGEAINKFNELKKQIKREFVTENL